MEPTASHCLESFAAALNAEFGAGVSPDAAGALHLRLHDGRAVSLVPSPDGQDLVFISPLAFLDRPRDTLLFAAALALNLHQQDTAGGAIGLDGEMQALVLSRRLPAKGADDASLMVALSEFCQAADRLVQSLESVTAEWPKPARDSAERRVARDAQLAQARAFPSNSRSSDHAT